MGRFTHIFLPEQSVSSLLWEPPFSVIRAGYYEKINNQNIFRENFPEAVLILCVDGKGFVRYRGKRYECTKGYLALLEPEEAHQYGASKDDPWTILWLHFVGDGIAQISELLRKNNFENVAYQPGYKAIFEQMMSIIRLLDNFDDILDIHKACCILQSLLLDVVSSNGYESSDRKYIRKAIGFMRDHIYDNINLDAIAAHLGITTFHVIRLFRESLMVTPMQYYHALQINEAVHLLQNTSLSVSEISARLNFSSPFYFSQAFKKRIGLSPAAYRKEMRQ